MFEWHGWATIEASPGVEDDRASEVAQEQTVAVIRGMVDDRQNTPNEVLDLRGANGGHHLWFAGSHNRDISNPVEFFQAVARSAPGSYGVLHTHDHDVEGPWIRWVMKRGNVTGEIEQALSPHLGAVEDVEAPG